MRHDVPMRLFRRGAARDPGAAIGEFWRWWNAEGAERTVRSIEDRSLESWAGVLGGHVDAVDPGLAWELAPGTRSSHVLVVTAGGSAELRPVARRWRRAAPPADEDWEYSDVRLPAADLGWALGFGSLEVRAADVRVRVTRQGSFLDLVVHHPAMAAMSDDMRTRVSFVVLDTALGEATVETWIGAIEASAAPLASAVDLSELRRTVAAHEAEHRDENGEPSWAILSARDARGAPVIAAAQVPLRPMTAPHLDTHVRISLAFSDVLESGLPGERSLAALRALEDHLAERLGGSGRVLAHETAAGARTLHVYADSTTPGVDQVRASLAAWTESRPRVDVAFDPGWERVRHLSR